MERPPVIDVGTLLITANRLLGARASAQVRELGLTPQQAVALLAIHSTGERHSTPGQIAKFMAADSPTVSGVIARLEKRGLVVASPNPADKRSRLITLTQHADDVLPGVLEAVRDSSAWAESVMPPAELHELTRLLNRFVELLSASQEHD